MLVYRRKIPLRKLGTNLYNLIELGYRREEEEEEEEEDEEEEEEAEEEEEEEDEVKEEIDEDEENKKKTKTKTKKKKTKKKQTSGIKHKNKKNKNSNRNQTAAHVWTWPGHTLTVAEAGRVGPRPLRGLARGARLAHHLARLVVVEVLWAVLALSTVNVVELAGRTLVWRQRHRVVSDTPIRKIAYFVFFL